MNVVKESSSVNLLGQHFCFFGVKKQPTTVSISLARWNCGAQKIDKNAALLSSHRIVLQDSHTFLNTAIDREHKLFRTNDI